MRKLTLAGAFASVVTVSFASAVAQGWPPWGDRAFGERSRGYEWQPRWEQSNPPEPSQRQRQTGGEIRTGGGRPEIVPQAPPIVAFNYDFPANSIVIDTGGKMLFFVLPDHSAYAYAISVGREGFNWSGTEIVSRKQAWPDWYPPAEMRERDPALPEKMTGGIKNPLGAMALYLGNTLYRIHGTNDAKSIGRAASSGCFRMLNAQVLHLASLTEIGTTVNVVASLPRRQEMSRAPEPPVTTPDRAAAPAWPSPVTAVPSQPRDYRALRDLAIGGQQR
jgi:lipoprotein-anchoring transpeptidase ErfK/SrfK